MRIIILAHGRIGRDPEAAIVDRYIARLPWPVEVVELPMSAKSLPPAPPRSRTVLLDERGEVADSPALAARIGRWRDDGIATLRFALGPDAGFSATDRAEADWLLSMGRLTWPHMLARAMLAEQLWRSAAILSGHPYHRA